MAGAAGTCGPGVRRVCSRVAHHTPVRGLGVSPTDSAGLLECPHNMAAGSPQTRDPREKAGGSHVLCDLVSGVTRCHVRPALVTGRGSLCPAHSPWRGRAGAATFGREAVRAVGVTFPLWECWSSPGTPSHCRRCSQGQDRLPWVPFLQGVVRLCTPAPWLRERPPRPRHRTQATVGHSRDRRRETGVAGALPSCPAQQNSLVLVTKPLRTAW